MAQLYIVNHVYILVLHSGICTGVGVGVGRILTGLSVDWHFPYAKIHERGRYII